MAKGTNLLFKAAALLIIQSFKLLQLQLDTIQSNCFCIPVALVISLHVFVGICEPYIDAIIIIAFNK